MSLPHPPTIPIHIDLSALLDDLLVRHQTLLRLTTEHHEAIRQADPRRCELVQKQQRDALAAIADLEIRRQALIKRAVAEIRPAPKSLARLSDLAQCAPESERRDLLDRIARLKALAARVQEEQNVVRVVSRVLLAHMEGLMRQVTRTLSHAGTYAKTGAVGAGAPIVTSLDIRH